MWSRRHTLTQSICPHHVPPCLCEQMSATDDKQRWWLKIKPHWTARYGGITLVHGDGGWEDVNRDLTSIPPAPGGIVWHGTGNWGPSEGGSSSGYTHTTHTTDSNSTALGSIRSRYLSGFVWRLIPGEKVPPTCTPCHNDCYPRVTMLIGRVWHIGRQIHKYV